MFQFLSVLLTYKFHFFSSNYDFFHVMLDCLECCKCQKIRSSFCMMQEKPDAFDKLVKEMAMEIRARPSDRTKTPEEIAQEERDRLEQLEVF